MRVVRFLLALQWALIVCAAIVAGFFIDGLEPRVVLAVIATLAAAQTYLLVRS